MRRSPTRHVLLLIGLVLALVASHASVGQTQTPTSLPLVQSGNMRYLGSFAVPTVDGSGRTQSTDGSLSYGGTALSISPSGGLYFGGHDWSQRLCEISIPAIGGTATVKQQCVDVTEGRLQSLDTDGVKLGGTLVYNGRLIVSGYGYYDADANQRLTHFASGTNLATTGDVTGAVQVGTAPAGYVSGYMAHIPAEWQGLLGGPALTGNCCIAIISRTSFGPAVSVFDPDKIGRATPVPAQQLLGYPYDHPLAPDHSQGTVFNLSANIMGLAFPAGTRSVMFIGRIGEGAFCYGGGDECGDPSDSSKGGHAYPYRYQVWAYDANDLLAVKNGQKQPYDVQPYAMWKLTGMGDTGGAAMSGATFDPATRRLYITEHYGESPRVHVYEITTGTSAPPTTPPPPPPPPAEVCGDGIDNDLDGQTDEGCTPTPPPPPPPAEVCGDGVDNDRDGLIDENCPVTPPPPAEVCGDGIDNDRDGSVDEGCPAPPPPPPPTEVCGDHIDNDRDGLVDENCAAPPPPPPPAEVCGDGVDNDRDGQTDEGCPPPVPGAPQRLAGEADNKSTVRLSWLAPISGGSANNYIIEAGTQPGQTMYTIPIDSRTNVSVSNVGTGKYYVRVRAQNETGISQASNEVTVSVGCSRPPNAMARLISKVRGTLVSMQWTDPDGCSDTNYQVSITSRRGGPVISRFWSDRSEMIGFAGKGTYYARVTAVSDLGSSQPTSEVQLVIDGAACAPPQFGTQFAADVNGNLVSLAWNPTNVAEALASDAVAPITYILEAGSGPGLIDYGRFELGRITSVAAPIPSGSYWARVRPMDICGLGTPSNEVLVRVP